MVALLKSRNHILNDGDRELFALSANPDNGVGATYFTKYYFGRELVPWQWYEHHAPQLDTTVIGGTGSGKTVGKGMSLATYAATVPKFLAMNVAPTIWQASLMAEAIIREADGNPFERFIKNYKQKPYPVITIANDHIGESTLYFMSAADDAKRVQGIELDMINIDEGGQILNPIQLMAMLATRTRGTVSLGGGKHRNRIKKFSIVSASYLEAPPWLWERMDMGIIQPKNFLSMSVASRSAGTLNDEDLELYERRVPKDQQGALLDAQKAEGGGIHFTLKSVVACEDLYINSWIQHHCYEQENKTADWEYEESPGSGCVRYEKPPEYGRTYIMAGDPGQGNPPHRNAGCVIVLDITEFPEKPAEMVGFHWIAGNGSYEPFKASYLHFYKKYKPSKSVVDATGAQALWDEQILLSLGVYADGMSFSQHKDAMLTSLIQMIQRKFFKYPYIQGVRSQLVRYDIQEDRNDNKLPQDIVVTLMMLAFALRDRLWASHADKSEDDLEEPVQIDKGRRSRAKIKTGKKPLIQRQLEELQHEL